MAETINLLKIPERRHRDDILLIPTGGTFDSQAYNDPRDPPKYIKTLKGEDSLLPKTVASLPHGGDNVSIARWHDLAEPVYSKDSKYFEPADMAYLASRIRHDSHRYFVLTHGTDALAINAEMLQHQLGKTDKTVVLVGAMVPLSMHQQHGSDGVAALDHVFQHIKDLPAGVYAAGMRYGDRGFFDPSKVDKDWDESRKSLTYTLGPAKKYDLGPYVPNKWER